jgi:hypothetical protein
LIRWDTGEVQELPECMKICFQALYDITNEMALEMQGEKDGSQALPHLKKVVIIYTNIMFCIKYFRWVEHFTQKQTESKLSYHFHVHRQHLIPLWFFSGQIFAKQCSWRQNGSMKDTHLPCKSIWATHGFHRQALWFQLIHFSL